MGRAALTRAPDTLEAVIVGSGFSGLAMGAELKRAGIDSFQLLEKAEDVGGTWRENTYPGAACDVPSHLYSFSFLPNPRWSRAFAPQAEILEYLRGAARQLGLLPRVRFRSEVVEATFEPETGTWRVRCRDGYQLRGRALVLGNGALHLPVLPELAGRADFAGVQFHTARWRHDVDLAGKRVAVIGTGASAIQVVPAIAPRVARLHVFQRTPPWIVPRNDRAFSAAARERFARSPRLERAYRAAIYWALEARAAMFLRPSVLVRAAEWVARRHLERSVPDPALRGALTPSYRMGCKRILLSDDYYPALLRPNVELVTAGIERITPRGVRTRDGVEREVDAIVHGTGFDVSRYLAPIRIAGAEGQTLQEAWGELPRTYLGITVSGFPNLYLLMGPNTGLGHNSMIFMIEAQARYAADCLKARRARGVRWLDVRPEVEAAFQAELRRRLARTVWQVGGCHSWYQTERGENAAIWPGFTFEYWRRTRRARLGDYQITL